MRLPELYGNNIGQAGRPQDSQVFGSAIEAPRVEQPDESVEMVAVQMADKHMADLAYPGMIAGQLHLTAFTAVDQAMEVVDGQQLAGRMSAVGRSRRVCSQYL